MEKRNNTPNAPAQRGQSYKATQKIESEQANLIKLAKANEKLRKLNTKLLEAIQADELIQVKTWIEKGANLHLHEGAQVHFYNDDENNPLHLAASRGALGIAKYLVEQGANINAHNRRKATPLHFAVFKGHTAIIKFLIEKGADIEAVDIDGGTPLSWAAYIGKLTALKLLTKCGANIHAGDNKNITPLHWACYKDNFEMVKFLIEHGAAIDIEKLNANKDTPLTSAIENGCTEIVLYLIEVMTMNAVRNAKEKPKKA